MCNNIKLIIIATLFILINADFWKDREKFIKYEESQMLGSSIILNQKEEIVNKILMGYKFSEYDAGFKNPGMFAPARHFFNSRKDIENSQVFKFIQKVPKGGALHGHNAALASFEILYNLTYSDNLYGCIVNGRIQLKFLAHSNQDKSCNWTLLSVLRKEDSNFDEWLRSQLTLDVHNPREKYPDINTVWKAMEDIFKTVDVMLNYKPIFQEYLYQALQELYDDNVMYLEIRVTLSTMYDLSGRIFDSITTIADFYKEVIDKFKKDHPRFIDARLIYAPYRRTNNETFRDYVKTVKELKTHHPDFLVGFDTVGQEDLGLPLVEFINHFKEIPSDIDFIFHAAETNWYGTSTDINIVDAILLGTKRIGHGYGLVKHPLALQLVKEAGIGIEVCPISNQVLMLVEDMRNHPAAMLIAGGYPVIISNDDPSFWSAKGLSYDFYMAFMGIASRTADLRLLKQLALNSLMYINQVCSDYLAARNEILRAEKSIAIGGKLSLTEKEKEANKILLQVKQKELQGVHDDITKFPPARHFFHMKNDIEKSKIFSILQKLPKGGALHTHLTASVSVEYVFSNIISRDNLHGCVINGRLKVKFFEEGKTTSVCKWELIRDLRRNETTFDSWVKSQISLFNEDHQLNARNTINDVWKSFLETFGTMHGMLKYKPVFQDHLYQALKELYEDNVFYVEFRLNFPELYELNGTVYGYADFMQTYSDVVQQFKSENPNFVGAKIIYARQRTLNVIQLKHVLNIYDSLQKAYPDILVGFDLVGFEDMGPPLINFHEQLSTVQNTTHFFFHAGETNWYGYDIDQNLIDAVLLGSKRIGHGYALLKHPKVLEMVKQKDIGIEISPISNQVLRLVDDFRNHPSSALIAQGYPVIICNDDPGFWGAKGLSYDWYVAYMGMASKDAGLELLKQLALNSIKYSSMREDEKNQAMQKWNATWELFIEDLIQNKTKPGKGYLHGKGPEVVENGVEKVLDKNEELELERDEVRDEVQNWKML
ncbi:hypothetical protein ILUMI_07905 [Ignelater luminosus]|uniref:Adenosine deaminase n=1 Tax=Ignelater luminosus TaxID=2038154 RepID=A0A8K0D5G2_IGNLU|nr:hypothetical protein ILUMI_07905 [Ignelater luminosus]